MIWLTAMEYIVTNDHGYVPFVVITIRSSPHSRLITGFKAVVTRLVPHVEQGLFTPLDQLRFLVGFMLLVVFFFLCNAL